MAFRIFPEEVWEIILDTLVDSQDILNAFLAYTELERDGILQTKKHLWLFDRTMPHLFPWLKQNDVLSCRKVCKQWCHGMDNFLENHPDQRVFSPLVGSKITGQHWIPEASPRHYLLRNIFGGVRDFTNIGAFNCFLQNMGKWKRNPFVGRTIVISDNRLYRDVGRNDFWNKALKFLQTFGSHVWFLKMGYTEYAQYYSYQSGHCTHVSSTAIVSKLIFNILSLVPNLKRLTLSCNQLGGMGDADSRFSQELLLETNSGKLSIPEMPGLETLEIFGGVSSYLAHILITGYSSQLKSLKVDHSFWLNTYSDKLTNLIEFTLYGVIRQDVAVDILYSLTAPKLLRIRLETLIGGSWLLEGSFIAGLRRFPSLESLHLVAYTGVSKRAALCPTSPIGCAPSVKNLCINLDLNCDISPRHSPFLQYFPGLEYLKVITRSVVEPKFSNPWDSTLWDLVLPKLQAISVGTKSLGVTKVYQRKCQEYLKKQEVMQTT